MKTSKKYIKIISIVIAIPLVVLIFLATPWILIYFGILFSPNPPKPEITYTEFPFELVYTLDENTYTINDIYVCEYDGIGMNEGVGKYIKWKYYVKSSKQKDIILYEKENIKIICDIGSPGYYMDDPEYNETYALDNDIFPNLILIQNYDNLTSSHILTEEEMIEYNIELISWEFSPPINNTFE